MTCLAPQQCSMIDETESTPLPEVCTTESYPCLLTDYTNLMEGMTEMSAVPVGVERQALEMQMQVQKEQAQLEGKLE